MANASSIGCSGRNGRSTIRRLEAAVRSANDLRKPVVVFFALLKTHPIANLRHYTFMIEGLIDTAKRLERRGIGLEIRVSANPVAEFLKFCQEVRPAIAVTDENPLRNSSALAGAGGREDRSAFAERRCGCDCSELRDRAGTLRCANHPAADSRRTRTLLKAGRII